MTVFVVTFVRHGVTAANRDRLIQGQIDSPLHEDGAEQAAKLGCLLSEEIFTGAYCSDLQRTVLTAKNILAGNQSDRRPRLRKDRRLRERNYGEAEGKTWAEVDRMAVAAGGPRLPYFVPPGAESCPDVKRRAVKFFKSLCETVALEVNDPTSVAVNDPTTTDQANDPTVDQVNDPTVDPIDEHINDPTDQFNDPTIGDATLAATTSIAECFQPVNSACSRSSFKSFAKYSVLKKKSWKSDGIKGMFVKHDRKEVEVCANVLVVSHGGTIREFIRYFTEEMRCNVTKCQGGMDKALVCTPNTGVSRFLVTVATQGRGPSRVDCLCLHNNDHLR